MPKQVAEYKHFVINELKALKGRKTRRFEIVNKSAGDVIGRIAWYSCWRQYSLFIDASKLGFSPSFIWSQGCLDDVSDFLGKLKEERKK